MAFERGKTTKKLEVIGKSKSTGTLITFKPDPKIFTITTEFKIELLASRLRELAFLNPGLEITFTDERVENRAGALFLQGRHRGIRPAARQEQASPPSQAHRLRVKETAAAGRQGSRGASSMCVLQYNDSYTDQILCFTNSIPNPDGGTHLTGFRTALTRAINQYARANNLLKEKDPAISGDDVREGLGLRSFRVKLPDPRFESQTKVKLLIPEVEGIVSSVVYEGLMSFFDANPPHRRNGSSTSA